MRVRLTARILLFDPQDRILLMKGRLSHDPARMGEWFTVGGGVRSGETVAAAAAREIAEECGLAFDLGPLVWRRDLRLPDAHGATVLFKEHYFVARSPGGIPRTDGWDDAERALMDDIRWWSVDKLRLTPEPVHPPGLADRLPAVAAGHYPGTPERLPAA